MVTARIPNIDQDGRFLNPVVRQRLSEHPSAGLAQLRVEDPAAYRLGKLAPTTWETPDGSGVVVHPSVRYFPDTFNGFHWWAAATPYANTDNQLENPCVFVSEDGLRWTAPPGVTNPLYPPQPGGYNSDTHLIQGPDGRLYLFFRDFSPSATYGAEKILLTVSADGIEWTAPQVVLHHNDAVKRLMSPAVWHDPHTREWVMLAVSILPTPNVIERWTAVDPFGPWSLDGPVTISPLVPGAAGVWHLDAMPIGSQIVALVDDAAADSQAGNLYLCVSDDGGRTFTRGDKLTAGGNYRSCLLPVVTDRGLGFDMWVGEGGPSWGAKRGTARAPRMAAWQETLLEMQAATTKTPPFVLGDRFDRADSTTGLGVAPTGQTWSASAGVMGITAGQATGTAASTNQRAFIETGLSDLRASVTVYATPTASSWLIFRYQDASNYLRVGHSGLTLWLQRVAAGAVTNLASSNANLRSTGTFALSVTCTGAKISVYENGHHMFEVSETAFQTATKVGLQTDSNVTRFDDLAVRTP